MRGVRAWTCLGVLVVIGACRIGSGEEITSTKPYANLIGAKYSVVADNLYAYGVYESLEDKRLSYVTLIPGVGMDGPEIAFRKQIPKGQVIEILSAWRRRVLFGTGNYYLVAVQNSNLVGDIPIRLEIAGGNEGMGAVLNPAIYRRLPRDN
jgi:hypothetical protein